MIHGVMQTLTNFPPLKKLTGKKTATAGITCEIQYDSSSAMHVT